MDRAAKAGAKKDRMVFIDAIPAELTEISKERSARKKLRKELCKEVRVKVRALKKSRTCVDSLGVGHSSECWPGRACEVRPGVYPPVEHSGPPLC